MGQEALDYVPGSLTHPATPVGITLSSSASGLRPAFLQTIDIAMTN